MNAAAIKAIARTKVRVATVPGMSDAERREWLTALSAMESFEENARAQQARLHLDRIKYTRTLIRHYYFLIAFTLANGFFLAKAIFL